MDLDPDLKEYLDNFNIICDDPENNDAAEQLIMKAKSKNPEEFRLFLYYNMYIFQNPQNLPESALYYSSILIMNAFRSSSPDEIKEKWFDPQVSDIQHEFKNTIISGLQDANVSVRNVCSTIIASIAFIEETWQELCGMLINNIKAEQGSYLTLGSITCLAELFSLPVIQQDAPLPDFMMELIMLLSYAIREESLVPLSRIDACSALIRVSDQIPIIYDQDVIDDIIDSISQSIKVDDLYLYLFNLLTELIKKNYVNLNQEDGHIISNIKSIICNEIQIRNGYFKCVAIDFFGQFADFEKTLSEPNYDFSCMIASDFVDQLLQCLIDIEDPQNQDPEDPLAITTHLIAATTLQALFCHNAQVIFERVKVFFENYIRSTNWIEVHAAIYSIFALCKQSDELDGNYSPTVKEFLDENFKLIIIHAGPDAMCLRTRETAMWIISSVIESYPMIDQDSEEGVNKLIELFEKSMDPSHPISIITRACKIFKIVASQCDRSYLDSIFQRISELILVTIQNIQPTINPDDATKPLVALNALIRNCSNFCDQQVSELLNELIRILQNQECCILLVSPICLAICTILMKIKNIIEPSIAESLLNPFIKLIDVTTQEPTSFQQNGAEFDLEIWESTFLVIANLIDLGAVTNSGIVLIITNSIFNALYCGDIRLTKTSLKVLGKLYLNIPPEAMEQFIDKTLSIITYLITSVFIERDLSFTSSVIFLYSTILERLGSNYIHFDSCEDHGEILQRINIAWRANFETENPKDVFNLYANIAHAYKCLAIGFANDQQFLIMECKKNIFIFIEMISTNHLFDDDVLEKIYDFLETIAKILKTRINILMNKRFVLEIVAAGLENENIRIAKKANKLHTEIPKM